MGNRSGVTRTKPMETTKHISKTLEKLGDEEFKNFKHHLQQPVNLEGFDPIPIPQGLLEKKAIADLIVQRYSSNTNQIMVNILKKLKRNDLLDRFPDEDQHESTDADPPMPSPTSTSRGVSKPKGLLEEQEKLKDDIPSPKPRRWLQVSIRWSKQLEKLANIGDDKVTKVESFVFSTDAEFCIGTGDGTEVFLGLTEDGTEVAVKRMTKDRYKGLKHENDLLRLPKLDHPSIVQYVDFKEDGDFVYLVLLLCEYTLKEYIKDTKDSLPEVTRKQLANQFLQSLSILHCQDPKILHRDIKPKNVLIDIQGNARLADFGISRKLPDGQSSHYTNTAGTQFWKAKETLDKASVAYKISSDIQVVVIYFFILCVNNLNKMKNVLRFFLLIVKVAGMLIYYILSGGHHPFGDGARCEARILDGNYTLDHVQDVVAKDLIEWMINEDPKKRPTVKECLEHPLFWSNERRVEYLRRIGRERDVVNCPDDDKALIRNLDQYAEQGQFNTWKHKFPPELVQKMDEMKSYPENSCGLLHFIHNLHEHYAEDAAHIDLLEMFPVLFGYVYKFAKEQGWNSRSTLEEMFKTQHIELNVGTSAV